MKSHRTSITIVVVLSVLSTFTSAAGSFFEMPMEMRSRSFRRNPFSKSVFGKRPFSFHGGSLLAEENAIHASKRVALHSASSKIQPSFLMRSEIHTPSTLTEGSKPLSSVLNKLTLTPAAPEKPLQNLQTLQRTAQELPRPASAVVRASQPIDESLLLRRNVPVPVPVVSEVASPALLSRSELPAMKPSMVEVKPMQSAPQPEPVFQRELVFPRVVREPVPQGPRSIPEPAPEVVRKPAPQAVREPVPQSAREPVPQSPREPTPQSSREPTPQSSRKPITQAVSEPAHQSARQPVSQSARQPISQLVSEPVSRSFSAPAHQAEAAPRPEHQTQVISKRRSRSQETIPQRSLATSGSTVSDRQTSAMKRTVSRPAQATRQESSAPRTRSRSSQAAQRQSSGSAHDAVSSSQVQRTVSLNNRPSSDPDMQFLRLDMGEQKAPRKILRNERSLGSPRRQPMVIFEGDAATGF